MLDTRRDVESIYGFLPSSPSVKPGVRFREIGEIVNRHATMSGLSVVKSSFF